MNSILQFVDNEYRKIGLHQGGDILILSNQNAKVEIFKDALSCSYRAEKSLDSIKELMQLVDLTIKQESGSYEFEFGDQFFKYDLKIADFADNRKILIV